MDRLRYEGYELPITSLLQAKRFAAELRERLARVAAKEVNRWYAERVVKLLDLAHFTPPDELPTVIERMLGARFSNADEQAPAPQLVLHAFGRARQLQDRALNLSTYLDLFPLEHTTLMLLHARNERMRSEVLRDERLQDCVYHVNDTPPEGVSESEWIRREALWRAALLPSGDDRIERIGLVLHDNSTTPAPDDGAALPGRISLRERVREHAQRMVVNARLAALKAAAAQRGGDQSALFARATKGATPDQDPVARIVASILSEHLPEAYAPDGPEAAASLNELFDPTLSRRLERTLASVTADGIPRPTSPETSGIERYLRPREFWK